jgi:hypothetical protein
VQVAGHLKQVGSDGVEPMVSAERPVVAESAEQLQPRGRSSRHGDRDGVVQRRHRALVRLHEALA